MSIKMAAISRSATITALLTVFWTFASVSAVQKSKGRNIDKATSPSPLKRVRSNGLLLAAANNEFTADLYQALFAEWVSKNLIFSPFSLSTVLGRVGLGGSGNTRTEIFRGLEFKEQNEDAISKSYYSVISGFQQASSPEMFTLLTANRVYSQDGFDLNQDFVRKIKEYFLADFEQLDFSTPDQCKKAAERINQWVESMTYNKIKDIIRPERLNNDTRLVLVNGIYFKGLWEHQFMPEQTFKELFHVCETEQVEVDMMFIQKYFAYGELPELDAKAVALPYKGGRLSMVIILPNAINGLPKLQASLASILKGGKSLVKERLTGRMKVSLHLPKFKIETTLENLGDALETLGIKSMFYPTADFSGIPHHGEPNLLVSSVIQKAFIEVNEEGAEAAAATAVRVKVFKTRIKTFPFVVDKPFYFQIVDHANGDLVLFSGHCNDPTQ